MTAAPTTTAGGLNDVDPTGERLARIEAILSRMELRLFGEDGTQGEIAKIHLRITALDGRVGNLENWRWWVMGAGFGAGAAVGYILKYI